jgi:AraC family transcriptional activator of mtrCDE
MDELSELCQLASMVQDVEVVREHVRAIAYDGTTALFAVLVHNRPDPKRAANQLLSLLLHRQAGRALQALLEEPGARWTLDALAARAHASRATLVRIFRKTAKNAPLRLLTELRLELARRMLWASDLTLAQIATEIGYQSESAFSRAFRRRFGTPPRRLVSAARRSLAASALPP